MGQEVPRDVGCMYVCDVQYIYLCNVQYMCDIQYMYLYICNVKYMHMCTVHSFYKHNNNHNYHVRQTSTCYNIEPYTPVLSQFLVLQ